MKWLRSRRHDAPWPTGSPGGTRGGSVLTCSTHRAVPHDVAKSAGKVRALGSPSHAAPYLPTIGTPGERRPEQQILVRLSALSNSKRACDCERVRARVRARARAGCGALQLALCRSRSRYRVRTEAPHLRRAPPPPPPHRARCNTALHAAAENDTVHALDGNDSGNATRFRALPLQTARMPVHRQHTVRCLQRAATRCNVAACRVAAALEQKTTSPSSLPSATSASPHCRDAKWHACAPHRRPTMRKQIRRARTSAASAESVSFSACGSCTLSASCRIRP